MRWIWAVGLGLVSPCLAAEVIPMVLEKPLLTDIARSLLGLILVLLVIFVCAGLLRRFGRFSKLAPGQFRVLAMVSLSTKERVVLLQVGEKQLLLGVTSGRIEALCLLEGIDRIPMEHPATQETKSSFFADRWKDGLWRRP